LRLAIKLKSRRGEPSGSSGMSLAIAEEQREPGEGEEIAPS